MPKLRNVLAIHLAVLFALVLGSLFAGARVAAAADAGKSEELIRQAIDLRRAGDDQGAYRLLLEAHGMARTPRSAAQLGFCEQALGRWTDAETHLSDALKGAGQDVWVQKNRSTIERGLEVVKTHIGRLEITGEPAGAEVLINGTVVGRLPLAEPVRLADGTIEIELRAAGYERVVKTLKVEGLRTQTLRLHAEKQAAPPAAPAVTVVAGGADESTRAAPGAELAGTSGAGAPPPPPRPGEGGVGPLRGSLKFVSLGLAAIAAGVGTYGILHNRSLVSEFDRGCGIDIITGEPKMTMGAPPPYTDAFCADLERRYESASVLGAVGLVGAGVFATAGLVLWLTEPSPRSDAVSSAPTARSARWTCTPGLAVGSVSLGCALRF